MSKIKKNLHECSDSGLRIGSKELEFITRYAEDLSEINQKKLEPEFEEIKMLQCALFQNDPEKLHKAIVRIATRISTPARFK